jgi:dynein heavy chain 2, cytosolic
LTPAIQAAARSLLSSTVPSDWTGRWEGGPDKPQNWLRELVRKRISLVKWRNATAKGAGGLLGEPLVLGDLFNPGTFINALRQQTARKLGTAIDRVRMSCSWDKDPKALRALCPLTCTLSGLLLQGASFHGGSLQSSAPEASEMTSIPHVTVGFIPLKTSDPKEKDTIGVPVYLSPSREDFLLEIDMPVSGKGDTGKWILSGVALFLSEDD